MKMTKFAGYVLLLCCMTACSGATGRPHWNDINVIRENAEAPRAQFVAYATGIAALNGDLSANTRYRSLNGDWKFSYSNSPAERPVRFFHERL